MRRFLIVVFFQSLRLPDQSWQKENCKYPAKAHTAWNTLMKPYAWIYKAWTIIMYEYDRHITYRISWSWSVHKSKLPKRQPPRERKRARETCLLYSFVFCVVCLQYKRRVLHIGVCLYPGGITWKLNGNVLTWPSLHNMDLNYGAWI